MGGWVQRNGSANMIFECTVLCIFDISVSELVRCQLELTELAQLIQRLNWLEGGLPITCTDLDMRIHMHVSVEQVVFKLCSVCF